MQNSFISLFSSPGAWEEISLKNDIMLSLLLDDLHLLISWSNMYSLLIRDLSLLSNGFSIASG
jgi:hypothetical protein